MNLELSRQILEEKNTQMTNVVHICTVAAELFHADRQTDGRMDGQT